jgi:hypothetical protein
LAYLVASGRHAATENEYEHLFRATPRQLKAQSKRAGLAAMMLASILKIRSIRTNKTGILLLQAFFDKKQISFACS